HVGVLAQVAVELRHEALAEPHDLRLAAAARVEVRSPLAAPQRHARQAVLERLLEPEELDDAEVHGGVEPEPALVRSQGAAELHPETAVDLHLTRVVLPGHAEHDLP